MSRRFVVSCDRARTDGCWLLEDMHEIRDLALADLLLVLIIIRATGIAYRVSIDRGPEPEGVAA